MLLNTFLINSKIQKTIKHKKLLDVGKNMYPKILYNAALVIRYTIDNVKDTAKAVKYKLFLVNLILFFNIKQVSGIKTTEETNGFRMVLIIAIKNVLSFKSSFK